MGVGSVSGDNRPGHVSEDLAAETRDREYAAKQAASFIQVTNLDIDPAVFVQLATTADQEALAKLINMLQSLYRNTQQSLEDDQNHEDASREAFEQLKASLESDKKLAQNIAQQDENRQAYEAEIARLIPKIDADKDLLAQKEKTLAATIKERADKKAQYESDKAERNEEKTVIKRLQEIIQKRLANISAFLRGHVNDH